MPFLIFWLGVKNGRRVFPCRCLTHFEQERHRAACSQFSRAAFLRPFLLHLAPFYESLASFKFSIQIVDLAAAISNTIRIATIRHPSPTPLVGIRGAFSAVRLEDQRKLTFAQRG
jgi:hypothetical protein